MSQYDNLKATIASNVYENHRNQVTANMVKAAMNAMTDSLGAGYQYMGIATPNTTPGTPDYKCFYIAAQPGTYTNFGTGITVNDGEVAVLKWDTAWHKEVTGAATAAQVTELGQEIVSANTKNLRVELEKYSSGNGQCLIAGGGRTSYAGYNLVFVNGGYSRYRIVGTNKFENQRIANWGFYSNTPNYVGSINDNDTTSLLLDGGQTIVGDKEYFDFIIENPVERLGAYLFLSINADCELHIYDATNEPVVPFNQMTYMPLQGWIQKNGSSFIPYPPFRTSKLIALNDDIVGGKLIDLCSQLNENTQLFGVHVYDSNENHIGLFYAPQDNGERYVSFVFDLTIADILSEYPTAAFIRVCGFEKFGGAKILGKREVLQEERILSKSIWDNNRWKLTLHSNVICIGDSVTQGFVVESNGETSPSIYRVMPEYSYPTQLGKLIDFWQITNAGLSGISPINWLANEYPNYDFSDYDLAIIELGYNGGLSDDISTPGTQSYAYRQIVSGIISQNPGITILLVISSCSQYSNSWTTTLNAIAQEFSQCTIMDIRDDSNRYVNLSERKYHGWDGEQWDNVHFNRLGYAAKAGFVYNRLIELL